MYLKSSILIFQRRREEVKQNIEDQGGQVFYAEEYMEMLQQGTGGPLISYVVHPLVSNDPEMPLFPVAPNVSTRWLELSIEKKEFLEVTDNILYSPLKFTYADEYLLNRDYLKSFIAKLSY